MFKGEKIGGQDPRPLPPFGYASDWVLNGHHRYGLLFMGATAFAASRQGLLLSKTRFDKAIHNSKPYLLFRKPSLLRPKDYRLLT